MIFDLDESAKSLGKRLRALASPESGLDLAAGTSHLPGRARLDLLAWAEALSRSGYLEPALARPQAPGAGMVHAQETLASLSPSVYWALEAGLTLPARLLALFGQGWQRQTLLADLAAGKLLAGLAVCEDHQNLRHNPLAATATPEGEGFRLSGRKLQAINGPVADWLLVAAMAPGGPEMFLVASDTPGLKVGGRLATLAFQATPTADLTLDNCLVPADQLLAPGRGGQVLAAIRSWEDQSLTCAGLGIMQRCLAAARQRAKEGQSGGRPLIAYQEIGFKLAEMLTLSQTAQLLARRAAWLAQAGDRDAEVVAACAKVFCAEGAETVASMAMQVLGSRGLLTGNPVEESYRDAKHLQIWGTSSEIARMRIGDLVLAN